ncbi:MAG: hypothetical protein QOE92_1728 [Chloroflexota bacterium]|jgi:CelD/BcsL family acetyltransferase involved in cellulose biosynthesis|nr:hypothetical protein [Chloroflexota bacterium]
MPATADPSRAAPAPGALQREVFTAAEDFERLSAEWEALEGRAAQDNLFLSYLWQHAWWAELGRGDLALMAFREGGRLVGIAPTYIEVAGGFPVIRFGGGLEVTDYLGILVEEGYELAVGRSFLEYCLAVDNLVLDLHFLRADGVTLQALTAAARDLDRRYAVEPEEVSPRIELRGGWDDYLATLSKKDRHELRRKRRRLEEAGGWTIRETSATTLAGDLETFFELHARSTRAKADFLTEEVRGFFRHICAHLQEVGWLSLRTLELDSGPAAAVLGFVYRDKLLLYNSGYDPEYNRLSAGFVLMSEEIRLAIEQGLQEVDFLRGGEKYKHDLGAVDVPLVHLTVELT